MTDFHREKYKGFGDCLILANDGFECAVTLELGPRIIRFSQIGGGNVYFEDIDGSIAFDASNQGEKYGEKYGGGGWRIYGGHRLWTAPENPLVTYYPDNDPVCFEISGESAVFTPREQYENRLRLQLTVSLDTDGALRVCHAITNTSDAPVTLSPWALTAVRSGGICLIPQCKAKTAPLPNRRLAVWPYTDLEDPRLELYDELIAVTQDGTPAPLKIGSNADGKAFYLRKNLLLEFEVPSEDADYPNAVPLEVYSCEKYAEIEILGALCALEPGRRAVLETAQRLSVIEPPLFIGGRRFFAP